MRIERITGTLLAILSITGPWPITVVSRPVTLTATRSQHLLPIVFMPGKGGSQIEARVDRAGLPGQGRPDCERTLDWYRMWMDLWTFFKHGVDCWSENTHLHFDRITRGHSNSPGVETRIPGWGATDSVEYVDPSWFAWVLGNVGAYAKRLIDALVHHGYERGVSVRGAPYDFRYAPHSQPSFFADLRRLVEDTWTLNDGRKVVLLAHSMGGLYAAYFLSRQPAVWKDRFIETMVTVNTPWAGTVVAVQMQAAGYNWEIDALDRLVIRDQQRSFESTVLLLPTSSSAVWKTSDVLLTTPLRNYTVYDYPEFFHAVGYPDGTVKLDVIQESGYDLLVDRDLGVPIHCFHGGGVPTPERLVYDTVSAFPDTEPRVELGEGDGTVNLRSLEACGRWKNVQSRHPVNVKYYSSVGHNELLHHPALISDILNIARST